MPFDLTVRQWGETLKVSRQRAYKIVKQCGIPIEDGKVDSAEATAIWMRHRDQSQANRGLSPAAVAANGTRDPELVPEPAESEELPGPVDDSRAEAQRILDWIRAKQAELELKRRQGELLLATEVERTWGEIVTSVKNNLLALPDDLAPKVAIVSDVRRCRQIIDNAIREVLIALSGEPELNDAA